MPGGLTILGLLIAGLLLNSGGQVPPAVAYDPKTLLMFLPILLTVIAAVKSGNIIIAATLGIVTGAAVAVGAGLLDFIQIDQASNPLPALFTVSGTDLDRTVGGVIYSGLSGMIQVCVLALLLFGATAIMRAGGGDQKLLNALGRIAKNARSGEVVISVLVIGLSALMGLNVPAILAVGASFAKPIAQQFENSPYRAANLLDAQSNTLVYCLPWTPAVVYTIGFAADSGAPLAAAAVTPFVFYSYALLLVMFASIWFGIGRRDGCWQAGKEKTRHKGGSRAA